MGVAETLNHGYVGTEHLLIGLLQEGTGVAAKVLEENGVEEDRVIELVSQLIAPNPTVQTADRTAYTPRARRVIENSYREAVRFKAAQIGTEHIMIAMLREGDCVASRLLNTIGVNIQTVSYTHLDVDKRQVTKDIYEDYYCARSNAKQDSGKSVRISRIATGIILVVVVIGSIYPPDFIWSLSTMSAGVMGAAFTAPLVLGLYWKRATRQGCMAGIIGGSAVSIIWYFAGLTSVVHSFVPGTAVSFLLMVLVSLCTPRMEEEHLDVFFEPGCSKNKIQAAIAAGSK